MGVLSRLANFFRSTTSKEKSTKVVAQAQGLKEYLYNVPTVKYSQGDQLIYRRNEYKYWYMGNIDYLLNFYTMYAPQSQSAAPYRPTWYKWVSGRGSAYKLEGTNDLDETDTIPIHAPVAGFLTDLFTQLTFSGDVVIRINNEDKKELNDRLQKALTDNDIQKFLKRWSHMDSWGGTTAVKASIDTDVSEYPILEVYEANKIDYDKRFNRITEIQFSDTILKDDANYNLISTHSRKGIQYALYRGTTEVDLDSISEGAEAVGFSYPDNTSGPVLAVWKTNDTNSKEFYDLNIGASDYEGLIDLFQVADEILSRFLMQIRATQPILFISEELLGYNNKGQLNKPKKLGAKVIPLAGGLSNVDGRSISAMFQRDIPVLEGVKELRDSFEWTIRRILSMKGLSPSAGNLDNDTKGANTTESSLYKREQTTHLVRKSRLESWTEAIKSMVILICRYFDLMDGKDIPEAHEDLKIDVIFPEMDADDFQSRVDEAVKLFTANLFDIEGATNHAFKHALPKEEIVRITTELVKDKEFKDLNILNGNGNVAYNDNREADTKAKQAKIMERYKNDGK